MKVFVYGTLKKGFPRGYVLAQSKYLGVGITKPRYSLYDLGEFPAAIEGGDQEIIGEVYEIDEDTLEELDFIEGAPDFYYRKRILLDKGGLAYTYFLPKKDLPEDAILIENGIYSEEPPPTAMPVAAPIAASGGGSGRLVFSYGSNNPKRLGARIGRPVKGRAAFLSGYVRVFRGHSSTWNWHGVASVKPQNDGYVFGYVEPLDEDELEILDGYEGVHVDAYRREKHTVKVLNKATGQFEPHEAIVYVATSKEKNAPNYAYLIEVAKTINEFWDDDGEVTPSDIEIR